VVWWLDGVLVASWQQSEPGFAVDDLVLCCCAGYGGDTALSLANAAGLGWLMHIDPDELIHLEGPAASLGAELAGLPCHVSNVRMMNLEGQPEAGGLVNRLEQVTLFKNNRHYVPKDAYWYRNYFKLGENDVRGGGGIAAMQPCPQEQSCTDA
jgi:hypothetical protein